MTKTQSVLSKRVSGFVWLLGVIIIIGSGCRAPRQAVYFSDNSSLKGGTADVVEFSSFKIKPDDILDISIQTLDPQNTQGVSSGSVGSEKVETSNQAGFMVDKNGYIELPIVGRMHVEGLTLSDAKEKIRSQAKQFFKDPLVNIRLANFRVTVIGEVLRPGTILVPAEKAGLMDVIGMVGDLTPYANRTKIVLIREEGTTKKFVNLDITSAEIFKSPYYYIKPGDVIYAEPTKARSRTVGYDATRDRYISYVMTAVSLALAVITFVRYSNNN